MHPMLNIAVKAARKAGDVIMHAYDNKANFDINIKGQHDYVTTVDKNAERVIIDTILTAYPEHSILAEESGETTNSNCDYQWIIDPIDGTLNFINKFPHFCISIAIKIKGRVEHGVIYDPVRNELFTASRGCGAYMDSRRIRVNKKNSLDSTFLATGFPVRQPEKLDKYLATFSNILKKSADIRRAGSAALDLAYVACGRLDGFFEGGLKIWDLAAGCLMITEAGGYVGDFEGGENYLASGEVIGTNIKLYKSLLKEIKTN